MSGIRAYAVARIRMRILDITPAPLFLRCDGGDASQIARLALEGEAPDRVTVHVVSEDAFNFNGALHSNRRLNLTS